MATRVDVITPIEEMEGGMGARTEAHHELLSISWKWVAGILTIIVVGLLGSWGATIMIDVSALKTAATVRSERVSVVETRMSILETNHRELKESLKEFRDVMKDLVVSQDKLRISLSEHRGETKR